MTSLSKNVFTKNENVDLLYIKLGVGEAEKQFNKQQRNYVDNESVIPIVGGAEGDECYDCSMPNEARGFARKMSLPEVAPGEVNDFGIIAETDARSTENCDENHEFEQEHIKAWEELEEPFCGKWLDNDECCFDISFVSNETKSQVHAIAKAKGQAAFCWISNNCTSFSTPKVREEAKA